MLVVGGTNITCAVLLAVGVSYFAATVLEEFYSYEQQAQYARGSMGKSTAVSGQMSTIGRYIYGQCLFIGWGAMVIHFLAGKLIDFLVEKNKNQILGAIFLCSSCGNASVGAQSYYGSNTMQNRLLSNQRNGATAPVSGDFQMPPKKYGGQSQDYI